MSMLTDLTHELFRQLAEGQLDAATLATLESLPADDLLASLQTDHPHVFLQRQVGRKRELGLAQSIGWEMGLRNGQGSRFPAPFVSLILRKCVIVSAYDQAIGEVTSASRVLLRRSGGRKSNFVLKMAHCFKLDKTPDGWTVRPAAQAPAMLSEELLQNQGWKFEMGVPSIRI